MFVRSLVSSWRLVCELENMDTQGLYSHVQWRNEGHWSSRRGDRHSPAGLLPNHARLPLTVESDG